MCGIFCSIWQNENSENGDNMADFASCKNMIQRRGPDHYAECLEDLSGNWKGFFAASILWMQGPKLVTQPCIDEYGNILLWNGDIFSGQLADENVSDTEALQKRLQTDENVPEVLKTVKGPYSVIYYQATQKTLYFARDPIGRHSMLLRVTPNCGRITLSSVTGSLNEYFELPAIGVFSFVIESSKFRIHPWFSPENTRVENIIECVEARLGIEISVLDALCDEKEKFSLFESKPWNVNFIEEIHRSMLTSGENMNAINRYEDAMRPEILHEYMKKFLSVREIRTRVDRVLELLRSSIKLRVKRKPSYCQNCIRSIVRGETVSCHHSKLGILFSGGLDSTLLAALADEIVPDDESIDLINVAFDRGKKLLHTHAGKNIQEIGTVGENFDVPDRKTGRQALIELQKLRPRRTWNFVECDVTEDELQKHRSSTIRNLVYPLSTILDDSLGCALWFASRASGVNISTGKMYISPCRVLLVGMGADELFGGYMRHRLTLKRGGWSAVKEELDAELARISERNLGRDDRVISDHGRQARFPYLDEDFVEYASSLNPWERCNPTEKMSAGLGDKLLLRLVAHHIGLHRTANFPKRALQFGSRIAKSKENAKAVSEWL